MDNLELWWLALGIFSAVVLVVAVLLGLVAGAAKSIDRQAAGIWVVGKQLAGNTVALWMLDRGNDLLRRTHDDVRRVADVVGSMDEALRKIAAGR